MPKLVRQSGSLDVAKQLVATYGRQSASATRGNCRKPSPCCLLLRSMRWEAPADLPVLHSGNTIRAGRGCLAAK